MIENPDTPEERRERRRLRRWKRRGRILAPFLGVPLLLLTLSLSVDLVEYQPHEESKRVADQRIKTRQHTKSQKPTRPSTRPVLSEAIRTDFPIPIALSEIDGRDALAKNEDGSLKLDMTLAEPSFPPLLRPPPPPPPPPLYSRR